MNSKKRLVNTIVNSLNERWVDWKFDKYYATHTKSNVSIWIANDIFFIRVAQPVTINFNIIDKLKIYKTIETAKNKMVLLKIS